MNPEDEKSLHEAKENMGDYKLKTASDYVVPQHLRVSTDKKRAQLLVHRKEVKPSNHQFVHIHRLALYYTVSFAHCNVQIFDTKKDYNQKLLALRDWKLETVEKVKCSTMSLLMQQMTVLFVNVLSFVDL